STPPDIATTTRVASGRPSSSRLLRIAAAAFRCVEADPATAWVKKPSPKPAARGPRRLPIADPRGTPGLLRSIIGQQRAHAMHVRNGPRPRSWQAKPILACDLRPVLLRSIPPKAG